MKTDKTEEIPVNLESLSNDNRVGIVLAIGCCMLGVALGDLMGWGSFFSEDGLGVMIVRPLFLGLGAILTVLSAQRLLIPGCKPLLRINFGGITDIRLVTAPIRWGYIVEVRRPSGFWHYLLPGLILQLDAEYHAEGLETIWSRLIHLPSRLRGENLLFVECATLDHSPEQTLLAIRSHLRKRQRGRGRR
ncbi:MAG: hypothetical protein HQL94_01430 [Magnetococcales bacterium]|nr:hypothetical protein [Magnetococcales bacterium]MBF0439041.1 hypothetical protein [Magnetococcales bacterium]